MSQSCTGDSPFHETAAGCVRELAEGPRAWAIPWPCIHEFLSVVTNRRVVETPTPVEAAVDQVRAWVESPRLRLLHEAPDHLDRLADLVIRGKVSGPQVHDARIAAVCLAHGVTELLTADRDVGRYPALTTRNPLVPVA